MLKTLLESQSKRPRSPGGALASVTAHTALIAGALYATAQGRVEPLRSPETVHPVYFPRPEAPTPIASPNTVRPTQPNGRRLIFVEPHVDIKVPPVDITGVMSKQDDFGPASISAVGSNAGGENPAAGDVPFRADQVEKQVALVPGSAPPRYPELLRSSGIEGQVTALFVVDETGRAEDESIRFVRSDNRLFENEVKDALRRMRFMPAEVGGRKVRQLVQMPFLFTLSR